MARALGGRNENDIQDNFVRFWLSLNEAERLRIEKKSNRLLKPVVKMQGGLTAVFLTVFELINSQKAIGVRFHRLGFGWFYRRKIVNALMNQAQKAYRFEMKQRTVRAHWLHLEVAPKKTARLLNGENLGSGCLAVR